MRKCEELVSFYRQNSNIDSNDNEVETRFQPWKNVKKRMGPTNLVDQATVHTLDWFILYNRNLSQYWFGLFNLKFT